MVLNFVVDQGLSIHAHDAEVRFSVPALEGTGEFLGKENTTHAKTGDAPISKMSEPHGIREKRDMCVAKTTARPV